MLLAKHGHLLRVFELKTKFCHLTLKNKKKRNIVRQLPSCLSKNNNGFHLVSVEYSKRLSKKFKPIDIYKPVKSPEKKFCAIILKTYENHIEIHGVMAVKKYHTDLLLNVITVEDFLQGLIKKKDIENCSSVPSVIYSFNNKNLIKFEDNFKYKGDVSMATYFDFQTTAPTDNCFDPEQKKMFVMPYVLIVAFHPQLNLWL